MIAVQRCQKQSADSQAQLDVSGEAAQQSFGLSSLEALPNWMNIDHKLVKSALF